MSFNNIEEHNPEEILKIIEEATLENYSNYEIENAFTIALKKYEEQGKKVESENISKEIKPFGWEYLFSQKKFQPFTKLEDQDFLYYKKRVQGGCNNYLKAKYCDLLWDHTKEVKFAKIGIDAHIKSSRIFCEFGKYHDMSIHLSKAFSIAKTMKDETLQRKCLKTHMDFIDKLKEIDNKYPLYDVIDSILENGYYIRKLIKLDMLLSIIKESIRNMRQKQRYDDQRLFLDLQEKYYNFINDRSKKEVVLIQKAQSYEEQADFFNKDGKNNLLSSHYFREAIEQYEVIGKFQEKIKNLKIKFRSCLQKGRKEEMVLIRVSNSDDNLLEKDASRFVDQFQNKNIDEIFTILASKNFVPTFNEIFTKFKDPNYLASATDIIPVTQIDNGLTSGTYSGVDLIEFNAIREYSLNYQVFVFSYLIKLFQYIKKTFPNYIKFILKRFEQGNNVDKGRLQYIKFGLLKFSENDFLSSIHILVFQIEGILRDLLIKLGEPSQKVMPSFDEFYSLGQIIYRIKKVKNDDVNVLEIIKIIETFLTDKRGTNIRNLIAHGYYPYEKNNIGYALFLVLILLKLSNLRV